MNVAAAEISVAYDCGCSESSHLVPVNHASPSRTAAPLIQLKGASAPGALEEVLRARFGLADFRPWQREAIEAILGEPGRVLVVAPTGGGKSLTYQLPARGPRGTTLVLSPLVALMEDQVRALEARGIAATFLASTLDFEERRSREAGLLEGRYTLVYVGAGATGVGVVRRAPRALRDRARRGRRGALHRAVGSRLPARLPAHRRAPRAPPAAAACSPARQRRRPGVRAEIARAARVRPGRVRGGAARLRAAEPPPGGAERRGRRRRHASRSSRRSPSALGEPKSPRGGAIVYAATRRATERGATCCASAAGTRARVPRGDRRRRRAPRVANAFAAARPRRSSSRRTRSEWGSIAATSARSSTCSRRRRSRRTTRRSGARGATATKRTGLLLCSGADIALRRRLAQLGTDGARADPDAGRARLGALPRAPSLPRRADVPARLRPPLLRRRARAARRLRPLRRLRRARRRAPGERGDDRRSRDARRAKGALRRGARAAPRRAPGDRRHAPRRRRRADAALRLHASCPRSAFSATCERDWVVALLRALLAAGWIDLTPTEHPVPVPHARGGRGDARRSARAARAAARTRATSARDRGAPPGGTRSEERASATRLRSSTTRAAHSSSGCARTAQSSRGAGGCPRT